MDENEHGTLAVVTQEGGKRLFCIKGTLKGQRVITLIDSGASHNFIKQRPHNKTKTENSKLQRLQGSNGQWNH